MDAPQLSSPAPSLHAQRGLHKEYLPTSRPAWGLPRAIPPADARLALLPTCGCTALSPGPWKATTFLIFRLWPSPFPSPALVLRPIRPQKGTPPPQVLSAQQPRELGSGSAPVALPLWHRPGRPVSGQPGPLSASHTSSPATPPGSFPPSKSLQNLTTVTRSAAATLHGRLTLTAFHSSEKHNHTVVCRALCSLVPAGSLQCPLLLPSLLSFSLMGLCAACGTRQGCSHLAVFMLHTRCEKLFPAHFLFVHRAPFQEDFPAPPQQVHPHSLLYFLRAFITLDSLYIADFTIRQVTGRQSSCLLGSSLCPASRTVPGAQLAATPRTLRPTASSRGTLAERQGWDGLPLSPAPAGLLCPSHLAELDLHEDVVLPPAAPLCAPGVLGPIGARAAGRGPLGACEADS